MDEETMLAIGDNQAVKETLEKIGPALSDLLVEKLPNTITLEQFISLRESICVLIRDTVVKSRIEADENIKEAIRGNEKKCP